jgi:hypothetical protein
MTYVPILFSWSQPVISSLPGPTETGFRKSKRSKCGFSTKSPVHSRCRPQVGLAQKIADGAARPDQAENAVGSRPIRRAWLKWSEAYFVVDDGQQLWAVKSRRSRKTFKTASGFK